MERICSRCKDPRDINLYAASKQFADGLHPWCKPCRTEYARSRRVKKVKAPKVIPSEKLCPNCKIKQDATQFYPYPRGKDGLSHECRSCSSKRSKGWQSEHKDATRMIKRRQNYARRSRKQQSKERYTHKQWEALCSAYGNICLCCKRAEPLTADHIIPLSLGGSDSISNIQPLCRSCNSKKHNSIIDYRC